jgi:hypothetical protein
MFPDATRPVIEPIELQALCRPAALGRLIAVGLCWLSLLRVQGGQVGVSIGQVSSHWMKVDAISRKCWSPMFSGR